MTSETQREISQTVNSFASMREKHGLAAAVVAAVTVLPWFAVAFVCSIPGVVLAALCSAVYSRRRKPSK